VTRLPDRTDPAVRLLNISPAPSDGQRLSGLSIVVDAREALQTLTTGLSW
jgi:TPP-dependent trihydroxycyclohexane-1,2-dione (THcHDO) dehydratase